MYYQTQRAPQLLKILRSILDEKRIEAPNSRPTQAFTASLAISGPNCKNWPK